MERQVARRDAQLWKRRKNRTPISTAGMTDSLQSEVTQLQSVGGLNQLEANQVVYECGDCVEHERDYKELDDLNNQERGEHVQQDIEQKHRIIDLEFQNQLLKDQCPQ
jgi:hypothetical protein